MFIQVIEGRTNDPEKLHRQLEKWERDLMPGAIGYLGSTGGCTSTGDCILIARFQDPAMAQKNSARPEQTAWWKETEACFDGPVRFHESTEVELMTHGPMDNARFVQVMDGHVSDWNRLVELEHQADPMLAEARPDLLGAITMHFDNDEFMEIAYFTDEQAARAAESKDMPSDAAANFEEWQRLMHIDHYRDIPNPWLIRS